MSHLSDEDLMVLYQQGDEAAFMELYRRYSGKIYAYLKSRQPEHADDIFQKVFLRFHQSRHLYLPKYKLAPWIFTITKNLLKDFLRVQKQTVPLDLVEVPRQEPLNVLEQLPLELLSPKDQQVLSLRYREDLEFEEIARRLSLSEVSVRKRISRALARLRSLIKVNALGKEKL